MFMLIAHDSSTAQQQRGDGENQERKVGDRPFATFAETRNEGQEDMQLLNAQFVPIGAAHDEKEAYSGR